MTKEELIALATKVHEGKATAEETKLFFSEFKGKIDDLSQYLSSLKDKKI